MAKCTICNKEIILVPSAAERSKKYGEPASYYTKLFTEHGQCILDKRAKDTVESMRKNNQRLKKEKESRIWVGRQGTLKELRGY